MGQTTKIDTSAIEWTGATWNPWQGCRHASPGCSNCYMFTEKRRYGQDPKVIHRSADATVFKPRKWQREAAQGKRMGQDRMVFTCSWSDWFIEEADDWRDEAWEVIRECPDLVFQILTKRSNRIADHLPPFWGEIRDRCWLGASAENQQWYDRRMPDMDVDLSPVVWWSLEPLLGPIDMRLGEYRHKPSWAVVGGESGPKARPMHPDHARSLRDQCVAAGVAYFFKQWGEIVPEDQVPGLYRRPIPDHMIGKIHWPFKAGQDFGPSMVRVGKKAAGRILDGRTWDQLPTPIGSEVTR